MQLLKFYIILCSLQFRWKGRKKEHRKCSDTIVSVVFPTFSHFLPWYFKATECQLRLSKTVVRSPVLITYMYVCFRTELTPAPHSVPRSTYRLKGPADTRVSLKCPDSAAGSGCATVQVSCWYTMGADTAWVWVQWQGAVAATVRGQWLLQGGDSGCCSLGTVATALRGKRLLQCGNSGCCSVETMAAAVRGQRLLQWGDSGCRSVGTVAAAVWGQWLLQCADISWYNVKKCSCNRVGTVAAKGRGQWLLQWGDSGCYNGDIDFYIVGTLSSSG